MIEHMLCCGCSACSNICEKKAIQMKPDQLGFFYPVVDEELCIQCGACDSVCPIGKKTEQLEVFSECYAGYLDSATELEKSSSGGAFYAIARGLLEKGFVVYGVKYADDYKRAYYKKADSVEELEFFRGSKYIQSEKKDIYLTLKKDLKNQEKVFFVGLPCEVAALKNYLKVDYENLYTADLICYGCTSPSVAELYVSWMEKKYKAPVRWMTVKDKSSGWNNPSLFMEFQNGRTFKRIFRNTEYGVIFNKLVRPSCYHCNFKGENRWSDLTLGDYWGIPKSYPLYNKQGVSLLFVNNSKGKYLLDNAQKFNYDLVDAKYARICNSSLDLCQAPNQEDNFAEKFKRYGLKAARDWKFWLRLIFPQRLLMSINRIRR